LIDYYHQHGLISASIYVSQCCHYERFWKEQLHPNAFVTF